PQEQRMLLRRTESHHLLDTRPVVPGPVEQDDLTPRRQVRDIALVVPLPALPLGGCRQRGYPRDARAQIFGDALDGPALARGVATFKDDHDPGPGFPGPFLEPHEFGLKAEKFGSVVRLWGSFAWTSRPISSRPYSSPHRSAGATLWAASSS